MKTNCLCPQAVVNSRRSAAALTNTPNGTTAPRRSSVSVLVQLSSPLFRAGGSWRRRRVVFVRPVPIPVLDEEEGRRAATRPRRSCSRSLPFCRSLFFSISSLALSCDSSSWLSRDVPSFRSVFPLCHGDDRVFFFVSATVVCFRILPFPGHTGALRCFKLGFWLSVATSSTTAASYSAW